MKKIYRLLPLALAAVLAGMALGNGGSAGAAGALTQVARHPREFLGQELRTTIQVESQPAEWNPYLTRFGTEDYRAVIAWGDEQDLWNRDDYESPAAMVFVRRGTDAESALIPAQRYARFEATGIVRQVLLGRPWIEITELKPLPEQLTAGSMIHASRGIELMDSEHWDLAAQSFERALASNLPARVHDALDGLRSECLGHASKPIVVLPKKKIAPGVKPRPVR